MTAVGRGLSTSTSSIAEMEALLESNKRPYNRIVNRPEESKENVNVAIAAQRLVEQVSSTGESTEVTLEKLKELQKDLETL